ASRAQVQTGIGKIIDMAPATNGDPLTDVFHHGVRILAPVPFGIYGAWDNGVGGYAARTEFLGDGLRETVHACLGRDVVRAIQEVAGDAIVSGGMDDAPPAALGHHRHHELSHVEA